ncbi:SNF2 family N-terminal domain-containing protein [Neofusicoccum parvum]|nr:SNF2 family N-terminal domain-containing protein [Neofusicoccum parvum]
MMLEKENGSLEHTEFGTMWSPMAQPDGSIRYKNTVVPFPQMGMPRLCLGGLLADDMGLGKTLSVLALITTYLDHVDDAGLIQDDVHPKMTTLIVCPLSLLLAWEDQIKSHIHPAGVSYHIYHGSRRQKPLDELRNYHIILTTYDIIAAEGRKDFGKISKVDKGILSLEWGRIVLDEAHLIRNATSQRHRALQRLKARHRWCLTVKALLNNLQAERNEATHPPIKSVIFSCWTKMLDQIGKALQTHDLRFERIDGSKSDSQRRSALKRFRTLDDCCILLASIGSAGVGLDLTVASRVHLMEPQWSPMAEEQALDRVHRMGQTRDVVATRYVVKDSIEEYVISVQELKSRVIKQSFEGGAPTETLTARERLMKVRLIG